MIRIEFERQDDYVKWVSMNRDYPCGISEVDDNWRFDDRFAFELNNLLAPLQDDFSLNQIVKFLEYDVCVRVIDEQNTYYHRRNFDYRTTIFEALSKIMTMMGQEVEYTATKIKGNKKYPDTMKFIEYAYDGETAIGEDGLFYTIVERLPTGKNVVYKSANCANLRELVGGDEVYYLFTGIKVIE